MTPLFKKLNYKNQTQVFILDAPVSFNTEIEAMQGFTKCKTKVNPLQKISFVLLFATSQADLLKTFKNISASLEEDDVFWICYPKQSSKILTCDFNRDTCWQIMEKENMLAVRQISIDLDWSALRFKNKNAIKTITRKIKL